MKLGPALSLVALVLSLLPASAAAQVTCPGLPGCNEVNCPGPGCGTDPCSGQLFQACGLVASSDTQALWLCGCLSGMSCYQSSCCATDASIVCASSATCGKFFNLCGTSGTTVDCGACPGGQVCTAQNQCCTPSTAAQVCVAGTCGQVADGCGGTVNCGTGSCATGQVCDPRGGCCTPATPTQAAQMCGGVCGPISDPNCPGLSIDCRKINGAACVGKDAPAFGSHAPLKIFGLATLFAAIGIAIQRRRRS